jgi:uncharacterized protein YndB with AHSA1/START domain
MISDPVTPRIEPVRKSVTVAVAPARAFAVFTGRMDAWWPFQDHSIFKERARGVEFEPRIGGAVVELGPGGERTEWGRLLEWNPPDSLRMTWHPGRDASTAQELTVRFVAVPEGTRVEIEHHGWEKLAERGAAARDSYDQGWGAVIAAYVQAIAAGIE